MERIKAVLSIINNYIVIAAFYVLAMSLLGTTHISWGSLCLFTAVPFVFYLIRCKCRKFLGFLCMHLLTAVIWWVYMHLYLDKFAEIILYIVVMVFYILFSFYIKGKTDDGIEPVIHPGIMVGMLLVGFWGMNKIGNTKNNSVMLIMLVLQVILYFAYHYIDNYISFVKVNRISVNRFHGKKLFRLGTALCAGYITFCTAILLLLTNSYVGNAITVGLKKIVLAVLKFIFSFVKGSTPPEETVVEEVATQNLMPMELDVSDTEPGLLAQIFDLMLEVLLCMVFVSVIVVVIVWVVRIVQLLFKKDKVAVIVEGEASIQDITEQLEKGNAKDKKSFFYGLSVNARIRKLYYKYVTGNRKQIEEEKHRSVSNSTAREIINDTAIYYEKARYSVEEATAMDLKNMKKTLNQRRK